MSSRISPCIGNKHRTKHRTFFSTRIQPNTTVCAWHRLVATGVIACVLPRPLNDDQPPKRGLFPLESQCLYPPDPIDMYLIRVLSI